MTKSTRQRAVLNELAAALIERLEDAEHLAIRTLPKTSRAYRLHTARLRQSAKDAAIIAAAIDIMVNEPSEIRQRRR